MGHNYLNCADLRDSCHVLEGVINHQRPLKCPMILSAITVKLPIPGKAPGHSHITGVYVESLSFVFYGLFPPQWIKSATIILTDIKIATVKSYC